MRILKQKVAKASELKQKRKKNKILSSNRHCPQPLKVNLRPRKPNQREALKAQLTSQTSKGGLTSSRNIVKNYSTAIISFALSNLLDAFFEPLYQKYRIKLEEFRNFIQERKEHVNCIKGLRGLLLCEETDSDEVVRMKELFKEISIIFIKRFCVNWIYHSKIHDKRSHLNYRFKMLRRVRNPVYFTYLAGIFNFSAQATT